MDQVNQLTIAPHFVLEPYSSRLRMQSKDIHKMVSPDTAIATLLHELAVLCMKQKGAVVGHIKVFAKESNGKGTDAWLKVSVIDAKHPPQLEGGIENTAAPVDITLNAHVIGLKAEFIEKLVKEAISTVEGQENVTITPITVMAEHTHTHNHG